MAIVEYGPGAAFPGVIGRTADESTRRGLRRCGLARARLTCSFIVLDDTGFGQLGCYGSPIQTPSFDALAANGLRYSNMHTTALCSPSRSCIITGRNHHSNGMAAITELASGYPGVQRGDPVRERLLVRDARRARLQHVPGREVPPDAEQPGDGRGPVRPMAAGPRLPAFLRVPGRRHQPVVSGPGSTKITRWSRRARPRRGTTSVRTWLTRRWSSFPTSSRSTGSSRSTCICASAPRTRRTTCQRNGRTGTRASLTRAGTPTGRRCSPGRRNSASRPRNAQLSRHDPDVPDWGSLPPETRRLYSRFMEVFAGFLSHTDHQVGRLVEFLRMLGELDNTLVMVISDNGASAEGGPTGTTNEAQFFNNAAEPLEDTLKLIDEIGGPKHINHYPWGWTWAGNTPFRRWKRETYRGGVSDPFIVCWPQGITARGECPHPVRAHHRHGAHGAGPAGHRAAQGDPRRHRGTPARGQLRPHTGRRRGRDQSSHAVLRDAGSPGDLP